MKIMTVYTTSKGTFWDKTDAEKKCNRTKINGSRPGDPTEYEPVRETFVLVDGSNMFAFALSPVKVM